MKEKMTTHTAGKMKEEMTNHTAGKLEDKNTGHTTAGQSKLRTNGPNTKMGQA